MRSPVSFSSLATTPFHQIQRILDMIIAFVLLIVTSPISILSALAVFLTAGFPVLYRQKRLGRFGKSFILNKFRTMKKEPEHSESTFAEENDRRILPVGHFMRRWRIDELPQLVNVLRGEMSLVGPRPPIPSEVAQYERWQMRRLSMKPGITCIWQVSGRNDIDFKTWMKLDLQYIDNWSLFLDLKLLLKTPYAVISGTGK